jgi:NADP-reducing hydrogenase subunit HndB
MKSIQELARIKQATLERMNKKGYRILVGMATCGIAAGAKPVLQSFTDEIRNRELANVDVTITGCIGACQLEPLVEVIDPQGQKVTYVRMDSRKAARVVAEHIVNGRICLDYTIGAALSAK